jgi:hypothetical protein
MQNTVLYIVLPSISNLISSKAPELQSQIMYYEFFLNFVLLHESQHALEPHQPEPL